MLFAKAFLAPHTLLAYQERKEYGQSGEAAELSHPNFHCAVSFRYDFLMSARNIYSISFFGVYITNVSGREHLNEGNSISYLYQDYLLIDFSDYIIISLIYLGLPLLLSLIIVTTNLH